MNQAIDLKTKLATMAGDGRKQLDELERQEDDIQAYTLEWRRIYYIGAIAAQFLAEVVFVCEILYSKKSTKTTTEDFTNVPSFRHTSRAPQADFFWPTATGAPSQTSATRGKRPQSRFVQPVFLYGALISIRTRVFTIPKL